MKHFTVERNEGHFCKGKFLDVLEKLSLYDYSSVCKPFTVHHTGNVKIDYERMAKWMQGYTITSNHRESDV